MASMHLVQILLPIHDNIQEPFPREDYQRVRQELTEKFGGITAYTRAPAEGHWKPNDVIVVRAQQMRLL